MKKSYYCLLGFLALAFSSCTMKLDPYSEDVDYITFLYEDKAIDKDTIINKTFVFYDDSYRIDTVYVDVMPIGRPSKKVRKVRFVQVDGSTSKGSESVHNAIPGVHYIAFDDESIKNQYVIDVDSTKTRLPIYLKRDKSLKDTIYTLRFALATNEDFQLVEEKNTNMTIVFSDMITKPAGWDNYKWGRMKYYFGAYSPERYDVIIKAGIDFGLIMDNSQLCYIVDQEYGYVVFWQGVFKQKLAELNALRPQDDPISVDGVPLQFK